MDWLINLWGQFKEPVMEIIRFLVNTGIGAAIGGIIVKGWMNKNNISALGENVATSVSNKLAGQELLVSLESVNKKQLETIKNELLKTNAGNYEIVKVLATICCNMGKIMLKFKAANEEDRNELLETINIIEELLNKNLTEKPVENKVVVKIEPVEEKDEETLF